MRRMTSLALLFVVAAALFGANADARRATAYCNSMQLTGRFTAVRGSAGAGNIVYSLVLRNRSPQACAITGVPQVTLLGLHGKVLPTHVRAVPSNLHAAPVIQLAHGASASATARFSPDVPGPGEQKRGACEQKAYGLAVSDPGGGRTLVPVKPPTPVCEHGQLQFKAYTLVH